MKVMVTREYSTETALSRENTAVSNGFQYMICLEESCNQNKYMLKSVDGVALNAFDITKRMTSTKSEAATHLNALDDIEKVLHKASCCVIKEKLTSVHSFGIQFITKR